MPPVGGGTDPSQTPGTGCPIHMTQVTTLKSYNLSIGKLLFSCKREKAKGIPLCKVVKKENIPMHCRVKTVTYALHSNKCNGNCDDNVRKVVE